MYIVVYFIRISGSLPAFRAFEAAVTTPFFLMLNFGIIRSS